jgi:hypothetical protein
MMRRCLIACALLASAFALSCGGEKSAAEEKPAAEKAAIPRNPEPAKSTEAALPNESAGERIAGKATQTTESGPGPESEIALALLDGGRLGGELSLGSAKCAISGMLEEAVARAWLSCPAAEGATAKRGALVGEVAGKKYSGTFAVSDDGAASVIRGTWTAGK